jgi:hypothetical protein
MGQTAIRDSASVAGREHCQAVLAGFDARQRRHARVSRQRRVMNDFTMQSRVVRARRQELLRDLMVNRPAVRLRKHPIDGLSHQIMGEIEPGLRGGGQDASTCQFGQAR